MARTKIFLVLFTVAALTGTAFAGTQTVTIATFDDPAIGSAEPLFTIDYGQGTLDGGWAGTGLNLEVPILGTAYADATFTMTTLNFTGSAGGGYYTDNGGTINFYDGVTEVLTISFDRLWIQGRESGLDGQDAFGDNVVISGVGIPTLEQERFGFTFGNGTTDGGIHQATASFNSSAVPEPATMALLALGGLMLRRRK